MPFKLTSAAKPEVRFLSGKFLFETTDTRATSDTTWETIGFNITREPANGDPTKMDHATIYLSQGIKDEQPDGNKVYVKFTIPEEVVSKALAESKLDEWNILIGR